jgi:hypothetical protein
LAKGFSNLSHCESFLPTISAGAKEPPAMVAFAGWTKEHLPGMASIFWRIGQSSVCVHEGSKEVLIQAVILVNAASDDSPDAFQNRRLHCCQFRGIDAITLSPKLPSKALRLVWSHPDERTDLPERLQQCVFLWSWSWPPFSSDSSMISTWSSDLVGDFHVFFVNGVNFTGQSRQLLLVSSIFVSTLSSASGKPATTLFSSIAVCFHCSAIRPNLRIYTR